MANPWSEPNSNTELVSSSGEPPSRAPPMPPSLPEEQLHPSNLERKTSYELIDQPTSTPHAASEHHSDHESSDSDWDKDDTDDDDLYDEQPQDLPAPLRVGNAQSSNVSPQNANALPSILRAGPPPGYTSQSTSRSAMTSTQNPLNIPSTSPPHVTPQHTAETIIAQPSLPLKSNNPYLRMQQTGVSDPSEAAVSKQSLVNSSSVWGEPTISPLQSQPQSQTTLAELPAHNISALNDNHPQPVQSHNQTPFEVPETPSSKQPGLLLVDMEENRHVDAAVAPETSLNAVASERTDPWADQLDHLDQLRIDEATAKELAHMQAPAGKDINPWREDGSATELVPTLPPRPEEVPPAMPPRPGEAPPPQPPRPVANSQEAQQSRVTSAAFVPKAIDQTQRNEHYSIKHIRWFDSAAERIRDSPILVQNANGPCPLLALVNALILSTPSGVQTALVDALRTREQVSLGLLLDAVFDELMTGRRGTSAQALPDVDELYQFLLALHTGMNVNPLFTAAAAQAPNLMDADGPIAEDSSGTASPGGFEPTREMQLYQTFAVPLVHGWLPPKGSEAYAAFSRTAKSFDEALNVQFREEELDDKLQGGGLSPDEISLFQDITSIKEFLNRWPTQLTDSGLTVLQQHLKPGTIAIFFRNDHFSTLIKEPRSGRLMSLVTDAGYMTHDEIVWESLVDVNGAGSELFSGDFRPVGGPAVAPKSSDTAPPGQGPAGPRSSSRPQDALSNSHFGQETGVLHSPSQVVPSGSAEASDVPSDVQADHDFALALQLQEEEDDAHRRAAAARREREDHLSAQFLEGEGRVAPGNAQPGRGPNAQEVRPAVPPRRAQNNTSVGGAAGVSAGIVPPGARQTSEAAEDAPPPTYEQASRKPAYRPGRGGNSSNPLAPINTSGGGVGRGMRSPSGTQSAYPPGGQGQYYGSRPQGGPPGSAYPQGGRGRGWEYGQYGQPVEQDRDKCAVM